MKFYGKAESVAGRILDSFKTGNVPKALAPIFIRRDDDVPCRRWSWSNQLLTALAGYDDARSYLDWQKTGRQVRKGEKGFYILEPCKRTVTEPDPDTGQERTRTVVFGFKVGVRFGYEQTDDGPLPARVRELAARGLSHTESARAVGCSTKTVGRMLASDSNASPSLLTRTQAAHNR